MKNWNKIFEALPDEEQDKLALLRVIETSNGVIQSLFRNGDPDALSLEETRTAMKFSMSAMKTQTIPLGDEVITFAPETAEIMKEVRELYISGFKNNNQIDYEEFMRASVANLNAIGKERIIDARQILFYNLYDIPAHCLDWGIQYIFGLMHWDQSQNWHSPLPLGSKAVYNDLMNTKTSWGGIMITFFTVWLGLATVAIAFNYFIQSINPRDDDEDKNLQ